MGDADLELRSETLGAMPVIDYFLRRMALAERLERCVPHDDGRLRLAPAAVIGVVVRNIMVRHRPVYALAEWAAPYDPTLLGLRADDADALNDDRVGRMLDRLFDADRATLITDTVLGVVREFDVELSQLHNDSTTLTLQGNYTDGDGTPRGGKPTPAIVHGHNKDFRPDLKQLLCILTISADGAVPVAFRVADGNTSDDVTHIPTWDELCALVGRPGFLYVADSKLCSSDAMRHIASHHGRFVTVVPHGRKEDTWFRDWAQSHAPRWSEAERRPGARLGDPDAIWRVFEAPQPSVDGYRVIWVHSTTKAARDAHTRASRIEKGLAAIEGVQARLASPKSRLRTRVAAEEAATAAVKSAGAERWVGFEVAETTEPTFRQERRGRPGSSTRYVRKDRTTFTLTARLRAETVTYDAATDGCFPLVTNDTTMTPAEILGAYRYQPNLERRNHMLKGPQEMAPVHLETPHRIEALLLCHFLALLAGALIEREIRTSMKTEGLSAIPLYPELRDCPAPSAPRIFEILNGLQRHYLMSNGAVVKVFDPKIEPVHQKVLDLLHVPASVYTSQLS
ncbi:MAG: IS1634 family transposase [Acidimicrobiales bacterium]